MRKYELAIYQLLLLAMLFLLDTTLLFPQCSISSNPGAVNSGSITPAETWQTTGCVTGGDYFTFTAVAGQQYNFTFCSNGGAATWDTEISINNAANAGIAGAYNDDFCGIQSQLTWIAIATDTFSVYVTAFGCGNNANCATLVYQTVDPPPASTNLIVQTGGNNSNAGWLVQNVFLSGCSQVSGITLTGDSLSIGYFYNGTSIGIQEGIIISSGSVTNAEGPNNQTGVTTSFGTPGDADLAALTSFNPCGPASATFDAAVLTFTFVPLTNSVSFQYVFASDEYDEWVCSSFNDVFGFFISGPGISGQQNIALVPGAGNTYVGINTVNLTNNSAYYNQNPAGSIITQYDGYTDVMTAVATGLTPCQTYTIKLAVADAGDSVLDSAVFLAANSFNAGNAVSISSYVPSSGTQDAYEGCLDGYFEFVRGDTTDLSQPITLSLTITGAALSGIDYIALPDTVTIPAGQISYQLPVTAYADLIPEGIESIIIQVNELQCNCTFPPPAQLNIFDSPVPFNAFISSPPTICPGETALIAAIASGSTFLPYTYIWSNGQSGSAISVSPPVTSSYSVTVTDACGRTANAEIQVTVSNGPPVATINPAGPFCSNAAAITLIASSEGGTWSGPGVNPNTGLFDPSVAAASGPGPYIIAYTASNMCGGSTASISIIVNSAPTPVIDFTSNLCLGNNTTLDAGIGYIAYEWSTGEISQSINVSPSVTTIYSVTVTTEEGCTASSDALLSVNPLPIPEISSNSPICSGDDISLIINDAATSSNTFLWSGPMGFVSTIYNPNQFAVDTSYAGTYSVTLTNTMGCTASAYLEVVVNPVPFVLPDEFTVCSGDLFFLNDISGGLIGSWSGEGEFSNIFFSDDLQPGIYPLTFTLASSSVCNTATVNATVLNPIDTSQTIVACDGFNYQLSFFIEGGLPPYSINGNIISGNLYNSPTLSGITMLNVVDAQGCELPMQFSLNDCTNIVGNPCNLVADMQIIGSLDDAGRECKIGVRINVTNGPPGFYQYSLDGINFQPYDVFWLDYSDLLTTETTLLGYVNHPACGTQVIGSIATPAPPLAGCYLYVYPDLWAEVLDSYDQYRFVLEWMNGSYERTINLQGIDSVSVLITDTVTGCQRVLAIAIPAKPPQSGVFYPNPNHGGLFYYTLPETLYDQPIRAEVFNVAGQLVADVNPQPNIDHTFTIDLRLHGEGMFIIRLQIGNWVEVHKVVVWV